MTQTDNPKPKMKLPENWAERMTCPVCGSRPLGVFHPTGGHADRFACGSCSTSFELEDGGKRLRFITLPPGVTPWMRGQWVVLEEAMAAFEVFKNEQGPVDVEDDYGKAALGSIAPREPTPEELRMRPPSTGELEDQAEFEARVREEQAEVESRLKEEQEEVEERIKEKSIIPPQPRSREHEIGYVNDNLLFDYDKRSDALSNTSPFYEEDFKNTGPFKLTDIMPEDAEQAPPAQPAVTTTPQPAAPTPTPTPASAIPQPAAPVPSKPAVPPPAQPAAPTPTQTPASTMPQPAAPALSIPAVPPPAQPAAPTPTPTPASAMPHPAAPAPSKPAVPPPPQPAATPTPPPAPAPAMSQPAAPVPAIKSTPSMENSEEQEDTWKNSEEVRVSQALVNPPKGDFAGHLAEASAPVTPVKQPPAAPPPSPKQDIPTVPADEDARPVKPAKPAAASVPTMPVVPQQSRWSPESATATRAPVDYPVNGKPVQAKPVPVPPPVKPAPKPVEIKPEEPKAPPKPAATHPDNLDAMRDHISGAMLNPTMDERMLDAMERAVELRRLGNTDPEVRSILERSTGLKPDEIAQVMQNLDKPEERKRSNTLLFIFLGIALVIFAILTWFFTSRMLTPATGQTPAPGEEQSTGFSPGDFVNVEALPEPIRTYVPNGLKVFNDNPVVEQATAAEIPAASCPSNQTAAASLFGGPGNDWTRDTANNGWMLMTTRNGVEVKIPANMNGGFLIFDKGPEMRGVSGPARVKNIYMISISCP